MKAISTSSLFLLLTLAAGALARPAKDQEPECEVLKSVKLSFYGREDTKDPIAYPECGRRIAGGKGTYESPLTMATAPGEFAKCEILYVPYLLKYVRFEDICLDCVTDYAEGKLHMQIWTGNGMAGGQEQTQCIKDFTPSYAMPAVRYPSRGQIVDEAALYQWGARDPCRLDHRYRVVNPNAFCYNKKEKASDHEQDQKNSVSALRHPYPQPAEEQPIRTEQSSVQDQEVFYDPGDTGWSLIEDAPAIAPKEPRIVF